MKFRFFPSFLVAAILSSSSIFAQDTDANALEKRLEQHLVAEKREELRTQIWQRVPFPKAELVKLLGHSNPAIRNEALELLEEITGSGFGFSPLKSIDTDANKDSLKKWTHWVSSGKKVEIKKRELSDDDARRYISDILTKDRESFYRAVRRLEPYHFNAVGKLQKFIDTTPYLSEGAVAKLKQAQYQIVLGKTAVKNSATVARELTFGSREQRLAGLNSLKRAGMVAIPILRDYLNSRDALIRETSVDAILDVGGEQVISLVTASLLAEKDSNVVHVALRKLKNIQGDKASALVAKFLTHEDEDIVISAIKVYNVINNDTKSFNIGNRNNEAKKKLSDVDKTILTLLDDNRWRVLSAALEYVVATKLIAAEDKVIVLLSNEDDFVKVNAMKAAVALKSKKSVAVLEKLLADEETDCTVIVGGLVQMQGNLTSTQMQVVMKRGVDAVVPLIDAYTGSDETHTNVIIDLTYSEDVDIACAALRAIASDRSRVVQGKAADALTRALRSDDEQKVKTVLASLRLPKNPFIKNALGAAVMQLESVGANKELNELYLSFAAIKKQIKDDNDSSAVERASEGGVKTLIEELRNISQSAEGARRMRVSILLAEYGDAETLRSISDKVSSLEPSERIAVAKALGDTESNFGLKILGSLIDDPSGEIRAHAAGSLFDAEENKALVSRGLEFITKPGAKVRAKELYSRSMSYTASSRESKNIVGRWCREVLANPENQDDIRILALVLLRSSYRVSDEAAVITLTKSENSLLRRAAWHTLLSSRYFSNDEAKSALKNDASVLVRKAFPMALNKRSRGAWLHYFSDIDTAQDHHYDYTSGRSKLGASNEKELRNMAQNDVSDEVRYEAMFTLLSYGKSLDLPLYIDLLAAQPEQSKAEKRLLQYVESNFKTMGRGMAPLISYLDLRSISGRNREKIVQHFFGEESILAFASFDELAKTVKKIDELPQHVEAVKIDDELLAQRKSVTMIYFYEKGCKECKRVEEDVMPRFKKDFADLCRHELIIKKIDINKIDGGQYNRALVGRLNTPKARGKKPAIFMQDGVLLDRDIDSNALLQLTERVLAIAPQDDWHTVSEEEKVQAKVELEEEYNALTLPIVIIAGLVDGINPCAFATIIFFLSYLQIARRSPKEIFFVGCAFILGVFLAYFSIGLVFHSLIGTLTAKFSGVKVVLNYVFALVALVVSFYSFKDYLKARKGDLKGMSLQLPGLLKNRVRSVIRKSSKATFFVFAAFVTGIVISFIELACTGQVYAPIIYQIQQGNHDAVYYLLCFNIAFVLPLIIIFGLAMSGMKSQALIEFQQKHTGKIKLLFAVLFLLLALMLLFNDQVSGWFVHLKSMIGLDISVNG